MSFIVRWWKSNWRQVSITYRFLINYLLILNIIYPHYSYTNHGSHEFMAK